jgi:hypothetical protein
MLCYMPYLALPEDFENNWRLGDNSTVRGVAAFIKLNSTDRADVYVGLTFDGYRKYLNISIPRPDIRMTFDPEPIISCSSEISFNPDQASTISIEVTITSIILALVCKCL